MDREKEEAVLRITADYVAEVEAGHAPRLGDYLARYPQYADAIAEFVTYYHAVEVDLPGESPVMPPLSEHSSAALERAWGYIQEPGSDGASTAGWGQAQSLPTLLTIASKRHLSLEELAIKVNLSQDIIEKLERRLIAASTLPQELLKQFAALLRQPLSVIAVCCGLSGQRRDESGNVAASLAGARVAEAPVPYQIEEQPVLQAQSFREVIEQSVQLSEEQKAAWRRILTRECL